MEEDFEPDMMVHYTDGVIVWQRNDDLSIVEYADGTTRPYNAEELLAREDRVSLVTAEAARASFKAAQSALITEINTNLAAVQLVIDAGTANTSANTKTLARAIKRTLLSVKDLAKMVS